MPAKVVASQAPIQGDISQLDQFRRMTKTAPISGATVPKRGPGRPPVAGGAPQRGSFTVPDEHKTLMQDVLRKQRIAAWWQKRAKEEDAGPWVRFYADAATRRFQEVAQRLRTETPNFPAV